MTAVGDILTYIHKEDAPYILDNKKLRWKKIKVTCYGGMGGNGGDSVSDRPGSSKTYGEKGKHGEIRTRIINLNYDDVLKLIVARNGSTGSWYGYAEYNDSWSATGGSGGGATTFQSNDSVLVGATGGSGGDGGKGYYGGTNTHSPAGGYGNPWGEGRIYHSRFGNAGGQNPIGTLISTESTEGKITVEVLELYHLIKYLVKDINNNLYTLNPNLINLNTQISTEALFKNQGFDNITLLNSLENKQNYKLLAWTDNTEAKSAKLVYNCNEFRPIDKLKESGNEIKIIEYTTS